MGLRILAHPGAQNKLTGQSICGVVYAAFLRTKEDTVPKITPFLWFDNNAYEAA